MSKRAALLLVASLTAAAALLVVGLEPARAEPAPAAAPAVAAAPAPAHGGISRREAWNQPVPPFRVIGNIHYVGAGVSSFLITTPEGAILLDGGLPETAPLISKSIAELGFQLRDVKFLINSHAHFDHAGGLAALKKATGAKLVASRGDAPLLRAGTADQPAVAVDRVIDDGASVELGGTILTAHVTPGHTPGCTSWTMTVTDSGKAQRVVFFCSTSVVDRLLGNSNYPGIVADYERSFQALRALPADVFLAPHPEFFELAAKRQRMQSGGPNPFIDPAEFGRYIRQSEQSFRQALERERREQRKDGAAAPKPPGAPNSPAAPASPAS